VEAQLSIPSALIEQHLGWTRLSYRARRVKRGLTNEVWELRRRLERVAFRIDRPNAHAFGIDRVSELCVHRAAHEAGIAPKVMPTGAGVLVTEWLTAKPWRADDLKRPRRLDALAECLHTLWRLKVPARELSLRAMFPKLTEARALDTQARVLCHGDLSCANLLGARSLKLIDFEFTAYAHPLYDLAQFAASNRLGASELKPLLGALGLNPPADLLHALTQAVAAHNAHWLQTLELHAGQVNDKALAN